METIGTRPDAALQPSDEDLLTENGRLKKHVEQLTRRVEQLTRQVQNLTAQLEQLRREDKRQAALFRKQDEPASEPKKPGRKAGQRHGRHAHRGIPPRIDEVYDAPLPEQCPRCGGRRLQETHVATQYQTEIPRQAIYRQFDVHAGVCQRCGEQIEGRHALQTSAARGAVNSQLGLGSDKWHAGLDQHVANRKWN